MEVAEDISLFNEEDKKMIMEKVVEATIKATLNNHVYKWGERIFRQMKGGAMGLRATGSVARMAMDE